MTICPFCGEPGVEKKLMASMSSTDAGMETGKAATCSNKECEISSHLFSIDTWETRFRPKFPII